MTAVVETQVQTQPAPRDGGQLRLYRSVPSALGTLRANSGRSLLTTLGITIGVAAVIVIVALAEGANAAVTRQIARLGTNLLTISPGSTRTNGALIGAGSSATLKSADATAIAQDVAGIEAVSPVVIGGVQVIAGRQNWATRVQAVMPAYLSIADWQIADGAAFTDDANTAANNVALLGDTVATNLFPTGQSPVGEHVRIRNVPFTVIGLLASKGAGLGGDLDDTVLIPFHTGEVRLFGATSISQIVVRVAEQSQLDAVSRQISAALRERHKLQELEGDDFTIRSNQDIVARASSVGQTMTLLLGGVAAVSLVVGGIGIMNIMLVSVTERTREIGIRRAVGARRSDVLFQFLVEAILLSVLGGSIGILGGASVALVFPILANWASDILSLPILADWPTVVPWRTIALAFGISALIGVFFGIYPARKAAQLDPIVALRYE
jgi:putative ABC transport system permease protein